MRTSLLLSSAAVLVTATTAFAADLPTKKAAPVEYVRVCNLGNGKFVGYVVPGTDVCLRVGGFARWQYDYATPTNTRYYTANGTPAGSRGYGNQTSGQSATASVQLDARTQTEYGLLRSYADMRISQGFGANQGQDSKGNEVAGTGAYIDKAWVQLGGFQAGKYQSYFDFYADAFNNVGALGSDHSAIGAAYTLIFGNFSAALSIEDAKPALGLPGYYGLTGATADKASEWAGFSHTIAGNRVPDAVLRLLYDDSWGQVQLSAVLHQVRANVQWDGTGAIVGENDAVVNSDDTQYGYAVQGGVKLNVPSFGPGDALYLQAAYADGAMLYLGASGNQAAYGGKAAQLTYGSDGMIAYGKSGGMRLTQGWNGLAAFQHTFTPTISAALWAGYTEINYASGTPGRDFHYWQTGLQGNWTPVKNLTISSAVNYINLTASSMPNDGQVFSNLKKSSDGVAFQLRVQRDF